MDNMDNWSETDYDALDSFFSNNDSGSNTQPIADVQPTTDVQPSTVAKPSTFYSNSDAVKLEIVIEPASSCRARYHTDSGISILWGRRGNKSHLTLRLTSSWPLSGRLIGLPVSVSSSGQHKPHLYQLASKKNLNCKNGVYMEQLQLTATISKCVMLTNIGIKKGPSFNDTITSLLKDLYDDAKTRPLFCGPSTKGLLLVDPMVVADERMCIMFVFIPDQDGYNIAHCVTQSINCKAGTFGGKTGFEVKACNPETVYWSSHPKLSIGDVWLQLNVPIEISTEQVTAELKLFDSTVSNLRRPVIVETELMDKRVVRLQLAKLTAEQLGSDPQLHCATVHITKLANEKHGGGGGGTSKTATVPVTFIKFEAADNGTFEEELQPNKRRKVP